MLYIIQLIVAIFGNKTAPVEPTAAVVTAAPAAEPAPALGWDVIDTAPDANWIVIEFGNHECEDFLVVLNEREYMTYSRTHKLANVKNRSNRGGWAEFTGRIDIVRHFRNGLCVGTKAVLAGGTALHTFQVMVAAGSYSDVQNCRETIQFLNW